jgi:hypothetical protein
MLAAVNLRHAAALAVVGWYLMVPSAGRAIDAIPVSPHQQAQAAQPPEPQIHAL